MRVATYNILATAYIRPGFYPNTPAELLTPAKRLPALVQRVLGLGADLLCLQEVDRDGLSALRAALEPQGYQLRYLPKRGRRPDGCATFVRGLPVAGWRELAYGDGSGHVALILETFAGTEKLHVANTHIKWDPPETPYEDRHAVRQLRELMQTLGDGHLILAGDFNVVPQDPVMDELREAGLRQSFESHALTCVANGRARKLDYLLHSAGLRARPDPVPRLSDSTVMPSASEPSDHLPLVARFEHVP
jgi:mRNA deadenylase 3'-5' endonuclease subunit Ccr4